MVAGLRHPSILFPRNLLVALKQAELEQIGLHEAAHLARCDDCALIVQRIVEALLVLHPVVGWIARQIDLEREIACDDFVVRASGSSRPYAACLTRVAELTSGVRSSLVAASAANERSHLTRRVDMLLDKSRHIETRTLKVRLGVSVVLIASLAVVGAQAPGMIVFAKPIGPEFAATALVMNIAPHPTPSPPLSAFTKPIPQRSLRSSAPPQTVNKDVMTIPLVVQDPMNRVVTGLDKVDFRLLEDGVEQEIAHFSSSDVPLSVGLLIDTSTSMGGKVAQVQEAVRRFLNVANPRDEFFVVKFNENARLAIGFTGDRDEVQRLAEIQPNGGVALFDAVSLAMRQMRRAQNSRKVVLVITDAGGNAPTGYPQARLLQEPKLIVEFIQGKVPVYALNIADSKDQPANFLAELTEQTGGRLFTIDVDASAMPDVATRIGIELRNLYVLEYTPRNTAHNGAYRNVQIELIAHPGLPPLSLHYRPGYYESR
jgi:Ca-activated chloride channel family protein